MKKLLIILALVLLSHTTGFSIHNRLQVDLSYSKFLSPREGPYLETYLSIKGNSIKYEPVSKGIFQGKLEVTMIFSKNGAVLNYAKYELYSPMTDHPANVTFNIINQKRFSLPIGVYEYKLIIRDLNNDAPPIRRTRTICMYFPEFEVVISDIHLIESFTKSNEDKELTKYGYDLVPYLDDVFPKNLNTLTFYAEIYNTPIAIGEAEKYLVKYFIESAETGECLNKFHHFNREETGPVNVVFSSFDISGLDPGNYYLVIEVRDRQNKLKAENKLLFRRLNFSTGKSFSRGISALKTKKFKIESDPLPVLNHEPIAVTDNNGKTCMAIEIVSDIEELRITSVLSIVDQQLTDSGTRIIYVLPEERMLTVEKEDYLPLRIIFSDYGISPEKGKIWQIKIEEDDKFIHTIVDRLPSFPGGNRARKWYLKQNLIYPIIAKFKGIEGTVYATFVVDTDGSLKNIRILRGLGGGCSQEAIRVLKNMPKWNPGIHNGEPVRVQFNMPFKFTLND